MDKLEAMALFVRVADSGSFSATARERGLSQSTVSKQIAALEQQLQIRLFNRTTRHISLTEAGTEYYEGCQKLLRELQLLESRTTESERRPSGLLRVSTSLSFGRLHVLPHVPEFLACYPEIELELNMDARRADLLSEGLDLAIRIGTLEDSRIVAKPLTYSRRVMVASPDYLSHAPAPQSLPDLVQHNCLIYRLGDMRRWRFDTEAITVKGNLSSNNMDALHQAALAGLGIALLPHWLVADDLRQQRLRAVLPDAKAKPVPINALYLRNPNLPSRLRCFLDFFSARISSHPDFC